MPTLRRECLLGCGHPPCGRHDPAKASLRSLSRVNMLVRLARDRTSALDTVLPGYDKDTADASHVEGTESFLLSGICGPRLTSVHQCADDTGIVHDHLGLHW